MTRIDKDKLAELIERAAISEFDGGLPRTHAEVLSALQVMPLPPGFTVKQRDAFVDAAARFLEAVIAERKS